MKNEQDRQSKLNKNYISLSALLSCTSYGQRFIKDARDDLRKGMLDGDIEAASIRFDQRFTMIKRTDQEQIKNYLRDKGYNVDPVVNPTEQAIAAAPKNDESEQERKQREKVAKYNLSLSTNNPTTNRQKLLVDLMALAQTDAGRNLHYAPSKLISELGLKPSEIYENLDLLGAQEPSSKGGGYPISRVLDLLRATLEEVSAK